jgi:hypothetical protein
LMLEQALEVTASCARSWCSGAAVSTLGENVGLIGVNGGPWWFS